MTRKKRIVLASNCLLNPFTRVYFLGRNFPLSSRLFSYLLEMGVGIVQMPCPETTVNGLLRWPMGRQQYDNTFFRRHCSNIMQPQMAMVEEFARRNYQIICYFGVEGSPSCGLSWGDHRQDHHGFEMNEERTVPGTSCEVISMGINAEVLADELKKRDIMIPFIEVPIKAGKGSARIDAFFEKVRHMLGDYRQGQPVAAMASAEER